MRARSKAFTILAIIKKSQCNFAKIPQKFRYGQSIFCKKIQNIPLINNQKKSLMRRGRLIFGVRFFIFPIKIAPPVKNASMKSWVITPPKSQ